MAHEFSFLEKQLISGLLKRSTDEEIAEQLEIPVDDIIAHINQVTEGGAAQRQAAIVAKRAAAEEAAVKKVRKQLEGRQREEKAKERQAKRNKQAKVEHIRKREVDTRESRRRYPNRDLKLNEKISVRIDHKTVVFVSPGADIEAIKKLYARKPIGNQD